MCKLTFLVFFFIYHKKLHEFLKNILNFLWQINKEQTKGQINIHTNVHKYNFKW